MTGTLKNDLTELHSACKKIRTLLQDGTITKDLEEFSIIKSELEVLYKHLYAIAEATLYKKVTCSFIFSCKTPYEIENKAHDIVVETFFKRTGGGFSFMIFDVIDNLFKHNSNPDPEDTFRFFKKVIYTSISNFSRRELGERNPLFMSTAKKLDYYIRNSERYALDKGKVVDNTVEKEVPGPFPTAEYLLIISSSMPIPTNVAKATDCFFNALLETEVFRSAVEISELRKATYKVLEHRLIDGELSFLLKGNKTPIDKILEDTMLAARIEALMEIRKSYEGNTNYSQEILEAFLMAGNDYLYDHEMDSQIESLSRYLSMHLADCKADTYERLYKGRFQHFIKNLKRIWMRKIHANPVVSLHIRGGIDGRLLQG